MVKLDEPFTESTMLAELRKRHKVVHIASHFQFSPGNETNSALLLGDGTFLSLAQIKSMPNVFGGVELLTLSACNTATGGSGANGKEVEGFGVLAQRQGAKAVDSQLVASRRYKHEAFDAGVLPCSRSANWHFQDRSIARGAIETVARRNQS